jgi:ATP dependent DNA ligase domain
MYIRSFVVLQCINASTNSFVLDAEAVAIDRTTGKLMPFQELSRRKRKDVRVEDIQVRVCLFAFDLLYLNGEVRQYLEFFSFVSPTPLNSHCFNGHFMNDVNYCERTSR